MGVSSCGPMRRDSLRPFRGSGGGKRASWGRGGARGRRPRGRRRRGGRRRGCARRRAAPRSTEPRMPRPGGRTRGRRTGRRCSRRGGFCRRRFGRARRARWAGRRPRPSRRARGPGVRIRRRGSRVRLLRIGFPAETVPLQSPVARVVVGRMGSRSAGWVWARAGRPSVAQTASSAAAVERGGTRETYRGRSGERTAIRRGPFAKNAERLRFQNGGAGRISVC